jgi:hypothetical protein
VTCSQPALPDELDDLMERVLYRLGIVSPPTPDLEGLKAVYRAWCAHVPFDNIRKMIALRTRTGEPLPGADAEDLYQNWLRHGCGGTCWPTSNALCELLNWLGFDARRVTGSIRDLGYANHASVKVRIGDQGWLVDSSLLTNIPLPLTHDVFVSPDPILPVEVEPCNGTHILWAKTPPNSSYLPCRILGEADHAFYVARYEESRMRSPFNQRLYIRRNFPCKLVILLGHTLFTSGGGGFKSTVLSPEQTRQALHAHLGISEALIEEWEKCGGLTASFEEPSGERLPPVTQLPPSKRAR